MNIIEMIISGTAVIALLATLFLYLYSKTFEQRRRRKALQWWSQLTWEQQILIEAEFFEAEFFEWESTGETTAIDIEAMYQIWKDKKI